VRGSVVGVTSEYYDNYNTTTSCGSGIIISTDGYIVTNYHVVEGANTITVTLDDGSDYAAYFVGSDAYSDIAVLQIQQTGLQAAEFGDSDAVRVGEIAIAIGNPTGQLQGTATSGIISALNRNVQINNTVMNLIQTDAAINSGNSGGPLLNRYGQVVGITSAKVSLTGYEGLGFAIPSNTAKPIIEALVRQGYVSGRPMLGVNVSELSKMAANFYRVPQGLYVNSVAAGSSAAAKGLKAGDIITKINGASVTTLDSGVSLRNEMKAGDTVTITIYRVGHGEGLITFTLMEQTNETTDCNF
jgi:serine protease Do